MTADHEFWGRKGFRIKGTGEWGGGGGVKGNTIRFKGNIIPVLFRGKKEDHFTFMDFVLSYFWAVGNTDLYGGKC